VGRIIDSDPESEIAPRGLLILQGSSAIDIDMVRGYEDSTTVLVGVRKSEDPGVRCAHNSIFDKRKLADSCQA
jgi:hypothetical protein